MSRDSVGSREKQLDHGLVTVLGHVTVFASRDSVGNSITELRMSNHTGTNDSREALYLRIFC